MHACTHAHKNTPAAAVAADHTPAHRIHKFHTHTHERSRQTHSICVKMLPRTRIHISSASTRTRECACARAINLCVCMFGHYAIVRCRSEHMLAINSYWVCIILCAKRITASAACDLLLLPATAVCVCPRVCGQSTRWAVRPGVQSILRSQTNQRNNMQPLPSPWPSLSLH